MIAYAIPQRLDVVFPEFFTRLCLDMFAIVQYWQPSVEGFERGRAFERVLYRYCEKRQVGLGERGGSRTINAERPASKFSHEQDAVIVSPSQTIHMELKYLSQPLHKNEILIFNQKGLDFLMGGSDYFRKMPLYRVILSGNVLSQEARLFAAQWGICAIEPDRLPLPLIYHLTNCSLRLDGFYKDVDEDKAREAVLKAVCPVQERVKWLYELMVNGLQPAIKVQNSWIINVVQREWGDAYWTALDDLSGGRWLEEVYDCLDQDLMLDAI